jgi:alpha-glucosidase
MNIFGRRRDGTTHDELIVRVYPSVNNSRFTLYEDDGRTTAYENGDVRTTVIEQFGLGVEIKPAEGTYAGALDARNNVIAFVTTNPTSQVMLNGEPLTPYTTQADFDAAESGWYADGNGVIWAKSGVMSVTETKRFAF